MREWLINLLGGVPREVVKDLLRDERDSEVVEVLKNISSSLESIRCDLANLSTIPNNKPQITGKPLQPIQTRQASWPQMRRRLESEDLKLYWERKQEEKPNAS